MLGVLEGLQDRLDGLRAILDMQVQRVQAAGFTVDLDKPVVDWEALLRDIESNLSQWESSLSLDIVELFERKREDFNTILTMAQKRRPDREAQRRLASLTSRWNMIEEQLREMVAAKRKLEIAGALETRKLLDETLKWMERGTEADLGEWVDKIEQRLGLLSSKINEDPVLARLMAFRAEKLAEYGQSLDELIHSVEEQLLVDRPLRWDTQDYIQTLTKLEALLRSHEARVRRLAEDGAETWQHRRACVGDLAGMVNSQLVRLENGVQLMRVHQERIKAVRNAIHEGKSVEECEGAQMALNKSMDEVKAVADSEIVDRLAQESVLLSDGVKFVKKASELLLWLQRMETEALNPEEVNDTSQLTRTRLACQQKKEHVLKECGALMQAGSQLSMDVSCYLQKISERKATVELQLQQRLTVLERSSQQYGEFKALVAQETDWLDKLEKRLRKSPEGAADAEDISEELDDLENYLRNHPDERLSRIQELGKSLVGAGTLGVEVHRDVADITSRWTLLSKQADERALILEGSAQQASASEGRLQALQRWLAHVDLLLTTRLNRDISAHDLPEDLAKLQEEFAQQAKILEAINNQKEDYIRAGRSEAASRLGQQLISLQGHFKEVEEKFAKFQTGNTLESRIIRATRELRKIDEAVGLIQLGTLLRDDIEANFKHIQV